KNGTLYCWGFDKTPNIRDGFPVEADNSKRWSEISLGYADLGIAGGEIYEWGGDPVQMKFVSTPHVADQLQSWTAPRSGHWQDTRCAIRSGSLYCWGDNKAGQLGVGDMMARNAPAAVGSSRTWQTVSTGAKHVCGIDGGRLYCWGAPFDSK